MHGRWSCSGRRAPGTARAARLLLLAALACAAAGSAAAAALPAPRPLARVHSNYTFNTSRDTFELCREQSGLKREISLEELLPQFGLPKDLTQRKVITLAQTLELSAAAAPRATLVVAPMLHGDADLAGSLSEALPRLVHFTVRDKDALVPHQAVSIISWAVKNPGYR
jgi:hypothetical protein